ncbi:MAG: 2'-5' RNA ligase family protein [Minisyncoccota bacterium]
MYTAVYKKSLVGETRGHHLFLMPPEGPLKDALRFVTASLAKTYGGPVFEPHITLAAEIVAPVPDIMVFAEKLVKRPAPRITFQGIETGTNFFKCCYLLVEDTPQLAELNRLARERFSITNVFKPHLSITYGIYPADVTRAMAAFAERALASLLIPTVFPAIEIWETNGPAEEWKTVSQLPFAA